MDPVTRRGWHEDDVLRRLIPLIAPGSVRDVTLR